MADDKNIIEPMGGDFLPASTQLAEVTRALQIANESRLTISERESEEETDALKIFQSIDKNIKSIAESIKNFSKDLVQEVQILNEFQIEQANNKLIKDQQDDNKKKEENREKGLVSSAKADFGKGKEDAAKEIGEKGLLKYIADITGFGGTLSTVMKSLGTFSAIIGTVLGPAMTYIAGTTLPAITGAIASMGAALTSMGAFIMSTVVPAITAFATAAMTVLAPVALVLAGALAAIEFIKGVVDGFTANAEDGFGTKILRGLTRGIEEVLDMFIMWPLDQIKNLVSWVAGALGFADVEKALDNFSFQESFAEIMDSFEEWITSIPTAISEFFSDMIDSLGIVPIIETIGEKLSNFFEPVTSMFSFIGDILDDAGNAIAEFVSGDFFDLSKIKSMMTNMFAEIGVPRIEFDVPVIGKVGFGPFYPFMPDQVDMGGGKTGSNAVISAKESSEIESTTTMDSAGNVVESAQERNASAIASLDSGSVGNQYSEGMSSRILQQEMVTENGGGEKFKESFGDFDFEKGEGTISISQTDPSNELNNMTEEFTGLGPVAFGQARRLVASGASIEEVRTFLKQKEKSVFKLVSEMIFGAPEYKESEYPVSERGGPGDVGVPGSPGDVGVPGNPGTLGVPGSPGTVSVSPTQIMTKPDLTVRAASAEALTKETKEREDAKASASAAPVIVNAPSTVSNNSVSNQSMIMDTPSALDGLSLGY